jgi:hypothetical protein
VLFAAVESCASSSFRGLKMVASAVLSPYGRARRIL